MSILREIREILFDLLSTDLYVKLLSWYLSVQVRFSNFGSIKAPVNFKVEKESNLIWADDGVRKICFYNPNRMARYIHVDGLSVNQDWMLKKYFVDRVNLDDNSLVIDVGANVGEFTLAISKYNPRVIAFEPDPLAYQCLVKNISESSIDAVSENVGLSNKSELLTFYLSSDSADSSFILPDSHSRKIDLQAITLDQYCSINKIGIIDLIKLEAEGFEPEVLIGAKSTLDNTRYISIDCGPERNGKSTFLECEDILANTNFSCQRDGWRLFCRNNNLDL